MIKYADFDFYITEYNGDLTEKEFRSVILPASMHVQRATFGRADLHKDREEVKLAACAVCDALADYEKISVHGQMIASENNDGYSVSYVTDSSKSAEEVLKNKIYSIIELYLSNTGTLNWGVE